MKMIPRSSITLSFLLLVSSNHLSVTSSSFVGSNGQNKRLKPNTNGIRDLCAESSTNAGSLKDYSGEAAAQFGNLRIPASLFAGASAGASFAMPLVAGEGLKKGMAKRMYTLLMLSSLCSQIITIVVSTISMAGIATSPTEGRETHSLSDFFDKSYELEWMTVRSSFMSGLIMFSIGSGLRSWISISCNGIAKVAVGLIATSTCLCIGFIHGSFHKDEKSGSMLNIPFRFVRLILKKSRHNLFFALATVLGLYTTIHFGIELPRLVDHLST